MVEQKWIKIGDVNVPVIIEEGEEWFPISYISEKLLLRKNNNIIDKSNKNKYMQYISIIEIKFKENNIQNCNCISRYGLTVRLLESELGRLTTEQKISQNKLHKYLGIEEICEKEEIILKLTEQQLQEYDEYTRYAIVKYLEEHNDTKLLLCSKCKLHYPMSSTFFAIHPKTKHGFTKKCHVCSGRSDCFKCGDDEMFNIVKQAGIDMYNAFHNDEIGKIYLAYLDGKLKSLPECYISPDSYLKIIKFLFDEKKLFADQIDFHVLINKFKLNDIRKMLTINEVYIHVLGNEAIYYPWKYKNIKIRKDGHTFEEAKIIFDYYLLDNNVVIDDKFNFKYGETIHSARIRIKDVLGFVVNYYDKKYAGYKFSTAGKIYYKDRDNLLFDLKYFVEQDLKIAPSKIPLYVTRMNLQRNVSPLYNFIVAKDNENIYYWINELYPGMFTERDFDIHYFRNEFDSIDESLIHDILIKNLNNVIYNARNTNRTITVMGMQPDWIVIGEERCWFIEYFGMYIEKTYSTRINDYIEKTQTKIKKYEKLHNYGKVFLYPDDLKNNFEGILNKIKDIK